jgi:hypothetical protein
VPRFVILEHDHPVTHWDLMLDMRAALRTWRLASPPSREHPVPAEPLGDHRRLYLDYEGPVSGGRGSVRRWDAGTYDDLEENKDVTSFLLLGEKTRGRWAIQRESNGIYALRFMPDRKATAPL